MSGPLVTEDQARAAAAYEAQLAESVAELLPGMAAPERLELLGAMDPDDMRTSLAFIASLHPRVFDFALVRDQAMIERLQDRLDRQYDDDPEPYCSACGASVGIFIGQGDAWLHYAGEGTAASPVDLFDAGHEPAVAWRENGRSRCCRHCEHGDEQPADRHASPCPDGCSDSDEAGAR